MNKISTVGIIGLGDFGSFIAQILAKDTQLRVVGHDLQSLPDRQKIKIVNFAELVQSDVIILAVPLPAYEAVLKSLSEVLPPSTLLVDVCSVKTTSAKLIGHYFPKHPNLLLTHPLFGSLSAATGLKGHKLIVTRSTGERADQAIAYCQQKLELDVQRLSAEKHDKIMAEVQALTFFVARALAGLQIGQRALFTPSYQMLIDLARFDRAHSDELFRTIQQGNPFAGEVRRRFIRQLEKINAKLEP